MLSREEVIKIAQLARIALTDDEVTKFQKELSSILSYVEQLNAVDTSGVEPLAQVTGLENALREDVVQGVFPPSKQQTEALLVQAPAREGDYLKVKSVLKAK
ncbi:MAG: Asp-tRNA(Asn)/Glu-tRNA(Gln) amidotransferase subunit GatC [Patescibacteria group bacterium]